VPAERGSAITLLYPAYTVVVPQPGAIRMPLTYPLAPDERWREFVNTRLRLKKGDGTIDRLYERWILGQSPRNRSQRWSVLHDVLGWVSPARCGCRQGPCAAFRSTAILPSFRSGLRGRRTTLAQIDHPAQAVDELDVQGLARLQAAVCRSRRSNRRCRHRVLSAMSRVRITSPTHRSARASRPPCCVLAGHLPA
jgi:hypothetical protein